MPTYKSHVSFFLAGALILLTIACGEKKQKTINTSSDVQFAVEGQLKMFKDSTEQPYADFEIEIADNDYEIQTGMMYRKSLRPNRGMLFIFPEEQPRYFYMKNTEISLDIIYLNAEKKIISFQKNAKPLDESSLPSEGPAQYVFEINGGQADALGMEVGDRMEFTKSK